jgi:type I restriction enzyme S subunit
MNLQRVPISKVAEVNPRLTSKPQANELVSFVPMAAVSEKTVSIESPIDRPFAEVSKGFTTFQRGDVIIAKITPCFENGKMAHAVDLPRAIGVGSTEFHVLRPKPSLNGAYLFHMLRLPTVRLDGARKMQGAAGQRRVPADFFGSFQIPLPPLAEQKRIAAILDAADALRTKRREALAQLDALLQSTFLTLFGDPVENPMGWPVVTIGDLLSSTAYGTSTKAHEEESGFPCLRMNNITYAGGWDFTSMKYVDLKPKEVAKNTVHKGQILFNRTNSKELVGKTAVYRRDEPMAFAGYLVRGITNGEADAEYISAFLNLPQGKAILLGMCKSIVGMANINAQEFKSISLPKPPLTLQRRFAAIVESAERQKAAQRAHLAELDALFAALQHRAFRGGF